MTAPDFRLQEALLDLGGFYVKTGQAFQLILQCAAWVGGSSRDRRPVSLFNNMFPDSFLVRRQRRLTIPSQTCDAFLAAGPLYPGGLILKTVLV